MSLISDTAYLEKTCKEFSKKSFVCVDTEFIRDKTYWPKLCLIQLGDPEGNAVAIDPLSKNIDLKPLDWLLNDSKTKKVFHAARQDIEIFYHRTSKIPDPIFDTQVAAMVCGFGESPGYELLAKKLANANIDKSTRYTNWSQRPLTDEQISYALDDVSYLSTIYLKLFKELKEKKRTRWIKEEMSKLSLEETYSVNPLNAWKKIKNRRIKKHILPVLVELASLREQTAQKENKPRTHIISDSLLIDIASKKPYSIENILRIKGINKSEIEGRFGKEILKSIKRGILQKNNTVQEANIQQKHNQNALSDLLKVLLKASSEKYNVAPRLIATNSELEKISAGDFSVPSFKGWKKEIFGKEASLLVKGKLALSSKNGNVKKILL